jgi:hypothetical protein
MAYPTIEAVKQKTARKNTNPAPAAKGQPPSPDPAIPAHPVSMGLS